MPSASQFIVEDCWLCIPASHSLPSPTLSRSRIDPAWTFFRSKTTAMPNRLMAMVRHPPVIDRGEATVSNVAGGLRFERRHADAAMNRPEFAGGHVL